MTCKTAYTGRSGIVRESRVPRQRRLFSSRIALASLALCSVLRCGGDSGVQLAGSMPVEPGTVETVSITPIEPPEPGNLIRNGDFKEWQAGTSAPDYFMAPDAGHAYSTLERATGPDGEETAVKQTWQTSDALDSYTNVFRTWVTGLRPNTRYEMTIRANNPSRNDLLLRAFQYNARSPAEAELMTEKPEVLGGIPIGHTEGFTESKFAFTTNDTREFCLLIAVKNNAPEGTFPASCVWDAWRLVEAPAVGPDSP